MRYLDGRPVLAQPDSARYRLKMFVRRHTLPVSAAAAIVLAVLTGTAAAVWQARVAIAERERAEQVKEFIASIMRDADPQRARPARSTRPTCCMPRAPEWTASSRAAARASWSCSRSSARATTVYATTPRRRRYWSRRYTRLSEAPDTDAGLVVHLRRLLSRRTPISAATRMRVASFASSSARTVGGPARRTKPDGGTPRTRRGSPMDTKHPEALAAAARRCASPMKRPVLPRMAFQGTRAERSRLSSAGTARPGRAELRARLPARRHGPRQRAAPSTRAGSSGRLCEHARDGWPSARGAVHAQAVVTLGTEVFGSDSEMLGSFLGTLANIQLHLGRIGAALETAAGNCHLPSHQGPRHTRWFDPYAFSEPRAAGGAPVAEGRGAAGGLARGSRRGLAT